MSNQIQHEPDHVLKADNQELFQTVMEPYPWLAIDFEEPRIVNSVRSYSLNPISHDIWVRVDLTLP